jgi:hypothetical protein
LGAQPGDSSDFAYRTLTFCGRPFHAGSAIREFCNSLTARQNCLVGPTTPTWQRLPPLTPRGFGLFPVRSPLLGESRLFSLPQGTEMFQFPWFPLPALCVQAGMTRHDPCRVFLFGDPRIKACLAAPRGLSQPATSFIGFQRLGIHRVPFATCRDDARARYGVLKGRLRLSWRLHGRMRRVVRHRESGSKSRANRSLQSCTVCPCPLGPRRPVITARMRLPLPDASARVCRIASDPRSLGGTYVHLCAP